MTPEKAECCPFCSGTRSAGETTFSVELGFGVVVIRHVPATVCTQCGADWIDDTTAQKLEQYVEDARRKQSQVEVVAFT